MLSEGRLEVSPSDGIDRGRPFGYEPNRFVRVSKEPSSERESKDVRRGALGGGCLECPQPLDRRALQRVDDAHMHFKRSKAEILLAGFGKAREGCVEHDLPGDEALYRF